VALDGDEWSASRSNRLYLKVKNLSMYPLNQRLSGPHSYSGHGKE